MATKKISALTTGTTANGTDKLPIERSGANFHITPAMIYTYILGLLSYKPGGTDVALADGGTGASLADPNADRIMFWDDSAGSVAFLTAGTGLTITGTTIDAGGGGSSTGLVARYHNSADITYTSSTETIINFNTSDYDPGTTVTTGAAWHFTAAVTARYDVHMVAGYVDPNGSGWVDGDTLLIQLYKNGSLVSTIAYDNFGSTVSSNYWPFMNGTYGLSLTSGDTVALKFYNQASSSRKLVADAAIEIYRVT